MLCSEVERVLEWFQSQRQRAFLSLRSQLCSYCTQVFGEVRTGKEKVQQDNTLRKFAKTTNRTVLAAITRDLVLLKLRQPKENIDPSWETVLTRAANAKPRYGFGTK